MLWTDGMVTSAELYKLKVYQKINHFPGMFTMSRKNDLGNNLKNMQKKFPREYNFFPKTWNLPAESGAFMDYFHVRP